MTIGSKKQFLLLWEAGCLGNRPRVWRTVGAALRDAAPRVGFREMGRSAGGAGLHEIVSADAVLDTAQRWTSERRAFFIDEAAPDWDVTLQGEICRTWRGLEGYLGVKTGVRMREAMRRGLLKPVTGSTILYLLDKYMDPLSRDDVDALLDIFPQATIELACYPYDVGVLANRNTLIWECREY